MILVRALAAAAAVVLAVPASAQLSNRSIALESGVSLPVDGGGPAGPAFGIAATTWLDGMADAIARVSMSSAAGTADRGPVRAVAGTLGVRLSLLPDPLRPQLTLEIGWARVGRGGSAQDRLALGGAAGVEWFPARDLSVTARAAMRRVGTATAAELLACGTVYF